MTAKRDANFSIDLALADPGFTPRVGDLEALLDRIDGEEEARSRAAVRAIARIETGSAGVVLKRLAERPTPALVEVATDLAIRSKSMEDRSAVVAQLASVTQAVGATKARRAAVTALGKILGEPGRAGSVGEAAIDAALRSLEVALADPEAATRRSVARALGAIASPRAAAILATLDAKGDATTARLQLAARRDAVRPSTASLPQLTRTTPEPRTAVLSCRRGLEAIVERQLGDTFSPRAGRAGEVEIVLSRSPQEALEAARSASEIAFPLPPAALEGTDAASVADAIARALLAPAARELLATFGPSPSRFRVAFGDGSKHRALVWALAERVEALSHGELANDPRDAPWQLRIGLPPVEPQERRPGQTPFARLELRPRFEDERFTWRRKDVPAASHPTVAAALAHVGGTRADDVVWDPFVGSAGELCERARLGPARAFLGTDVDEGALAAAKENLAAARVSAQLVRIDARDFTPTPAATLLISNPPMGRRVLRREGDVRSLLVDVLSRTRRTLAPGGRVVWLSAHPQDTREAARAAGLALAHACLVDLGGFEVELQRFDKPR